MSDFIAPKASGVADYLGMFAVSAGFGLDALIAKYEADHDDYKKIMAESVADRLAEALAEIVHLDVRKTHWGYAKVRERPSPPQTPARRTGDQRNGGRQL